MTGTQSSNQTLSACKVLLTRPATQQQSLQKLIEEAGGSVISLPLIAIQALLDEEHLQKVRRSIQNLDQYSSIIFVSTNAAGYGAELINDYWPQFPVGISVLAIGNTTARAVTSLLDCSVIRPADGSDSEALLQLPELENVKDKKIAIIRGQGGRELLAETLLERGAEVHYIEVYRREFIDYNPEQLTAAVVDSGCTAITVHSGESLKQLLVLSGHNIAATTGLPLVVPSARIRDQAQEAGFSQIEVSQGATDSAMLDALQKLVASADI